MADLINELSKKTGIDPKQAADMLGDKNVEKIAADLGSKVGIDEDKSKEILGAASGALSGDIASKIKNPFG